MTTTASSNIKAGQQSAQKVPLGATVNIPPRRLDFQFDDKTTARYFYDNDPFLSAFWLSLLCPVSGRRRLFRGLLSPLPHRGHRRQAESSGSGLYRSGSHAQ